MANYQSYVICTTPRSGSTLLCKLLAATGVAGKPDSYFHTPSLADWLQKFDLTPDDTTPAREILAAVFEAARLRGTAGTDVFGLRLQRKSFDFLFSQIDLLHPGLSSHGARFQAVFGKTLFIHLSRRNKLEQAVSFVRASQTGLWHRAPDGSELERLSPPQEPHYDADAITHHLAELTALDKAWQDWFAGEAIAPLRVNYDALSRDPEKTAARVLERLGLDPTAAQGLTPAVAKLADATSRNWMERFRTEKGS